MTMDRVLSNGGVPPVCSATSPSSASPGCGGGGRKLSLTGGAPSDEEDADDPEVMQVVSSGGGRPLNLRLKREPRGEERERPMSWEGELSGTDSPPTPGSPMCIAGDREQVPEYQLNQTEVLACTSNGQDNCPSKGNSGTALVVAFPAAPSPLRPPSGPFAPSPSAVSGASGHQSPYLGGDRPSSGRSITFEPTGPAPPGAGNSCLLRGSPAQGRHPVVSYLPGAGGYSQSPSPVLNRPTSSCSSRSSYSPTQSPLLGRGPHYGAPTANAHSPVLSRHGGGTSSDGSVYSPTNSPLQGRHVSSAEAGSVLYSPAESPSQGRHPILPDSSAAFPSPSQSPAHLRHLGQLSGGSPRPPAGPLNVSLSPSPLNPGSATVTPDQVVSSNEALHLHLHGPHQNYVDHLNTSSLDNSRGNLHHGIPPECRSTASSASVASSASDESNASDFSSPTRRLSVDNTSEDGRSSSGGGFCGLSELASPSGSGTLGGSGASISRQQLLSGPCPICGDRISGFHYGIFSCESCKGFFKRTVQNKKNYVCLRGAKCAIAISTRKKCPACRFDKCLKTGMKLEAIREDRTRGGRSTYQCSYTLASQSLSDGRDPYSPGDSYHMDGSPNRTLRDCSGMHSGEEDPLVPPLMQEILSVEHLWHYTDREMGRLSEHMQPLGLALSPELLQQQQQQVQQQQQQQQQQNHLLQPEKDQNFLNNLCNIADHRLYKIVKWCKSLPLFRDIEIDDQIALLINSWCELLLLSCCYRSMASPQQEILVSHGKSVSLGQAKAMGLGPVIERMLNLTEHLRRLQVDQYEYVCLKVIILLTSDVSGLKESTKVGICQKQVLEALQTYTRTHYPQQPSKFGELLLRIPELERACQVGKESLASKQRAGEVPSFNLLMELLRGDH